MEKHIKLHLKCINQETFLHFYFGIWIKESCTPNQSTSENTMSTSVKSEPSNCQRYRLWCKKWQIQMQTRLIGGWITRQKTHTEVPILNVNVRLHCLFTNCIRILNLQSSVLGQQDALGLWLYYHQQLWSNFKHYVEQSHKLTHSVVIERA